VRGSTLVSIQIDDLVELAAVETTLCVTPFASTFFFEV